MRIEHFPNQRKSKLNPRGDEPFQVLEKIDDNAFKLDLPCEYENISADVRNRSIYIEHASI